MNIPVDAIKIKKRVRKNPGDINSLVESIKHYGLLNPITINEKNELIAGERRLQAVKQLGWHTIPVVVIHNADSVSALEIEIEENVQRSDFTEEELMKAYIKLNKMKNPGVFARLFTFIMDILKKILKNIRRLFRGAKKNENQ